MKKSKLLLATPLMLAPVVATLPVITSCGKKSDVALSGDFAKNVDIETFDEPLVIGEPYVVSLSIKQDQVGKQYLPNSLKTVKSGDVELWLYEEEEMSNGIYDYYQYVPYANNTKAYLYINNVSGKISIEAATSELDHITATPMLTNLSENVEYEVGETANTAGRILATGTLKNDDIIILTEYSIKLDGYSSDYTFVTADIDKTKDGKKGTISYNGLTSKEFTFKVLTKTLAYLTSETSTETKTEKFASLELAVTKYNTLTTAGDYTISIAPGKYDVADVITINEKNNINLLIKPLYWSEEEYEEDEYWVQLNRTGVTAASSLFSITGNDSPNNSISIIGIQFNEPEITGTRLDYSHISLSSSARNINVAICDFEGNEDNDNNIYAIKTVAGQSSSNVSIVDCEGEYLESLYKGSIEHVVGTEPDLMISYCSIEDSKQLFSVTGTGVQASIYRTYAGLMWDPAGSGAVATSGMSITGTGTYLFNTCSFKQWTALSAANGFVRIDTTSTDTKARELIFEYCSLSKVDEDTNIHDVYNATGQAIDKWSISWTDLTQIKYGSVDGATTTYWDHPTAE